MSRVLVMLAAGETYEHDNVRWYRSASKQDLLKYHNIGDSFVYDSSLKLIRFDALEHLRHATLDQALVERWRRDFDYILLRGSNYVHAQMAWLAAAEVLERVGLPVIAFGIGAQAPKAGPLTLSADAIRVLQVIANSTTSIGVRGEYTAQVLNDIGIKNVRIIGCPTAFRHNSPRLKIAPPAFADIERVGFTLRREVNEHYSRDIARYMRVMRDSVLRLAQRYDVTLMAQGELQEKMIVFGGEAEKAQALEEIKGWLRGPGDPMWDLYLSKLFYSDSVADYEALVRRQDLVVGYRLHGNLMALANGVPAVYFTYDSRTEEFVHTFKIPAFDIYSGADFELEAFCEAAAYDAFSAAYEEKYAETALFLSENGVRHKLHAKPERAPPDIGVPIVAYAMRGGIEDVSALHVSGWARDLRRDGAVTVAAVLDGYPLAHGKADLARREASAERCGFRLAMPRALSPAELRRIKVLGLGPDGTGWCDLSMRNDGQG